MPRKDPDPEEYKRFLETARKVGADKSEDVLEQVLKKIAKQPSKAPKQPR